LKKNFTNLKMVIVFVIAYALSSCVGVSTPIPAAVTVIPPTVEATRIPTETNIPEPTSTHEGGVSFMSPTRVSRFESAIRVVLEFNEAFNRHDVAGMMRLMSDDCIFENTDPAPDGTVYSGKEAVTQFWQDFFRESPHANIKIEEIFGYGERCIMRWRYSWVNLAGEKGHVRGVDIFRVKNGSICEKLSYVKG
jgi:predicted SnoaL-like aldol condensation-catalyzing enzyme